MSYRKIGFLAGTMTLRGVSIAQFDYAFHNQEILGNRSVIFYDGQSANHQAAVVEKFREHFELVPYQTYGELSRVAENSAIDALYILKSGEIDDQKVEGVPNLVHAVFPQKMSERHGAVYAFVSEWLSKECSNYKIPYVPHMIWLPEENDDLRVQLGIPGDAVVFGCYGGSDSFNLPFVHQSIRNTVEKSKKVYQFVRCDDPRARHRRVFRLGVRRVFNPQQARHHVRVVAAKESSGYIGSQSYYLQGSEGSRKSISGFRQSLVGNPELGLLFGKIFPGSSDEEIRKRLSQA